MISARDRKQTSQRVAMVDLALCSMAIGTQPEQVDSFHHDRHPDLRSDYVLANGSMSSHQSGEGDIRRALIDADFVDGKVVIPEQLFSSTQIPVCLWFLRRDKSRRPPLPLHPPLGEGRGEAVPPKSEDLSEFCKSDITAEIAANCWALTLGPYVGPKQVEDHGEHFDEKMPRQISELEAQVRANLKGLGYAL